MFFSGIKDCILRDDARNIYFCSLCQQEFTVGGNCRRHVKEKHFGLNQELCPFCNQVYLKRHIQGHLVSCKKALWLLDMLLVICCAGLSDLVQTTNSGFICCLCNKMFSDKSNCRRHVKEKHHKLGSYCCPYCSRVLHRSKIQSHMTTCQGTS